MLTANKVKKELLKHSLPSFERMGPVKDYYCLSRNANFFGTIYPFSLVHLWGNTISEVMWYVDYEFSAYPAEFLSWSQRMGPQLNKVVTTETGRAKGPTWVVEPSFYDNTLKEKESWCFIEVNEVTTIWYKYLRYLAL